MKRVLLLLGIAAVAATVLAAPSFSTQGHTPAQLVKAGWDCPFVLGAVHCAPPGGLARVLSGEAEAMHFSVFTAAGEFLGTEEIIRVDKFRGQPCPTDPPGRQYTDLRPILGLPYFACHRYNSGF